MGKRIKLITPPVLEPVSTPFAKSLRRVEHSLEDELWESWIKTAREEAEKISGLQLCAATWRLRLDAFPAAEIKVPRPPLLAVTSFTYIDTADATQTLTENTDFAVDLDSEPARLTPAYGEVWPTARGDRNCITVLYRAGYETPAAVPERLRFAIAWLASWWDQNREAQGQVPQAFYDLVRDAYHGCTDVLDVDQEE